MKRPTISVLTLIVVGAATPATVGLSLYTFTGDQRYRPLGLTSDGLGTVQALDPTAPSVEVELRWAPRTGTHEEALAFGRAIRDTFKAKGYSATVVLLEDPGALEAEVTFEVGQNLIGPYSLAEAVYAVSPSVDVMRAFQRTYPERFAP